MSVVPAVELSTVDGSLEDLHLLGYGFDHRDPVLLDRLTEWRADRARRGLSMAAALGEQGFALASRCSTLS